MAYEHKTTITFNKNNLQERSFADRIGGEYNKNLKIIREVAEPHGVKVNIKEHSITIVDKSAYHAGNDVTDCIQQLAEYCNQNPIKDLKAKKQDIQIPKRKIEDATIPLREKLAQKKKDAELLRMEKESSYLDNARSIETPCGDISPRTETQAKYINALKDSANQFTIGTGPAGTGKTFLAVARAVEALKNKEIDKIIITRPAISKEQLGFLPGDSKDKLDPYMRPIYDALNETFGEGYKNLVGTTEDKVIEIAPIAFMRGRTLKNAFVIGDEIQNIDEEQMKMFLTRAGENAHYVLCGDPGQVDLPNGPESSGLVKLIEKLGEQKSDMFVKVDFPASEVVRSEMGAAAVNLYEQSSHQTNKSGNVIPMKRIMD